MKDLKLKLTENLQKVRQAERKLDSPALFGGKEKEILQEVVNIAEDSIALFKDMKTFFDDDSDEFEAISFSQALLNFSVSTGNEYITGQSKINPKKVTYRVIQAIEANF